MQSGTIESMRELNHPRNTKYLWQRVQWIAKVAQMNVLKRIFSFCFRARAPIFFLFILVWFGFHPFHSQMSVVRARALLPLFPILHHFNYVLLSTASFSVIFIAAFYSLPRSFSWTSGKNCLRFYWTLPDSFFSNGNIFFHSAIPFSINRSVGEFFSFSFCIRFFLCVSSRLTLKKWCSWWTPKSDKNKLCRARLLLVVQSLPLNLACVTHSSHFVHIASDRGQCART